MNPFFYAFRLGFTHALAYRTEVLVQIASAAIVAGLTGSIWSAVARDHATVAGVPSQAMVAYVVLAWVSISFAGTRVNEDIGRRFREGLIASDLLRPMNFQLYCYARDLGRVVALFPVQTLPLLAGCALVWDLPLPSRPITWAAWLTALLLAHATNHALCFIVGIAAFHLHNISGLTHLKNTLVSVFSGAMIPLELLGPLQPLALGLPFRAMAQAPAAIFMERPGAAGALFAQVTWALLLAAMGAAAWRGATRSLTVQGG